MSPAQYLVIMSGWLEWPLCYTLAAANKGSHAGVQHRRGVYCIVYCIASYCIQCGGARNYVGHYHYRTPNIQPACSRARRLSSCDILKQNEGMAETLIVFTPPQQHLLHTPHRRHRSTRPKRITRKGEADGTAGGHGSPTRSMHAPVGLWQSADFDPKQQTSIADFDHVTQTSI